MHFTYDSRRDPLHLHKKYVLTFSLTHTAIPTLITEIFMQGLYLNKDANKQKQ